MTSLALPDLPQQQVEFVPDDETVRADEVPAAEAAEVAASLAARVRIGGPLAVPVSVGLVKDDDNLKAFVAAESGKHAYYLVHLAATFTSGPGDPAFESATLDLALSTAGVAPVGGQPPIAWSMLPQRVTDDATSEFKWNFGPEVTVEDAGVKLGSIERTTTRTVGQVVVEGLGLLRSDPSWRVSAVPRRPIGGSYRFVLIVRAVHGATVHVAVAMRVTVRERRLLRMRSAYLPPVVLAADLL
jgi:hypothetical protein